MRILFLFFTVFSLQVFSQESPIEEVIAYGIRPGPELWKVSNGANVLWILGTLSPLPKKMTWHTTIVETVMEGSQALLMPPVISAKVGFFQGLSLATSAIGMKKNPNKQKLKDVVPADIYLRWLKLKKKYIGKDKGIEKTRPLFAADKLFEKALKKTGLTFDTGISKKVRKLAKKKKLKIITPTILIDLNKPKAAIKKFKKTQISDLECFTKTLNRIEVDLNTMRLRANAWAYGDVTKIKNLPYEEQSSACMKAVLNTELAQGVGMKNLPERTRAIWLEEAQNALNKNKSTFAILSIENLLNDDSYLVDLLKLGYKIKVPK